MIRFALQLVRPYWKWLLIVLVAMFVDTAMSLASPWPLKIVLDSVFDARPMPSGFAWLAGENADRLSRLNIQRPDEVRTLESLSASPYDRR